jgi:hypothetical protein
MWLERYLEVYRPLLGGDRYTGHRLWISYEYRSQDSSTIRRRIMVETERAFGIGLSPHLFRDSLATSLAIHDPEVVGIAHVMLGNALATTQRHYNLARSLEASRSLNHTLESLREECR